MTTITPDEEGIKLIHDAFDHAVQMIEQDEDQCLPARAYYIGITPEAYISAFFGANAVRQRDSLTLAVVRNGPGGIKVSHSKIVTYDENLLKHFKEGLRLAILKSEERKLKVKE